MNSNNNSNVRVVADLAKGSILGEVEVEASPERVFQALASDEIIHWWVRPGVFNTTEWTGDVRVGGHWRTAGLFRGEPYVLEGDYLEIDSPRRLVHTYGVGAPWGPTTIEYNLEPIKTGTRVTLRHSGFISPEKLEGNRIGWETSFEALAEYLQALQHQSNG